MAQSLPRFCSHCGAEAISTQKFCRQCGSSISDEVLPQSPTQSLVQAADQSPSLSLGPTADLPSSPGSGSVPNSPAYSVPKRPSAQTSPPVWEQQPTRVSRPTLKPLTEVAGPSSEPSLTQAPQLSFESLADQTLSSAPDEEIVSIPTQMLQAQGLPESSMQPQEQSEPIPLETSLDDAVAVMPTQALQARGPLPQSSLQTQMPSMVQTPPLLQMRSQGGKRVSPRLVLVVGLIVVLGGLVFGIVAIFLALRTPSQSAITTTTLGTTVNYAGVDVTVVNAQQSQLFLDDPNSRSDGMLRLHLHAQNITSVPINLPYETITHVTLPGGKVVGPTYVKFNEHMAPNATGSGLVDFAVPQNVPVSQVVFHLGSVEEAQLDIPLNGRANVDQYASKTVHPNQPLSYYGLNWTLTDASLQFHIDGHQASKGMRYLILTLKVNNPLFQTAIPGSPYDYVQLTANNAAIPLVNTTLPVSFDGGASGKGGTVTFLVPQDAPSFVLTLSNPAVDGFAGSKPVAFQF